MQEPDFKDTLNLPLTDFPMRGDLAKREPQQIEKWLKDGVFQKRLDQNASGPTFLLHDGPPYANGDIHIGHALNKVLKDVIVKFRLMQGFHAPFVPGWDCHGLPIELGVEKQLAKEGLKKEALKVTEVREKCRQYAKQFIETQSKQFQALQIFALWNEPYLTYSAAYCAGILKGLARMQEAGHIYRENRPVHWCASCGTALAEAEIEYKTKQSDSIFVGFKALDFEGDFASKHHVQAVYYIIWTTTPWTLPSNQALAINQDETYVCIKMKLLQGTFGFIVAEKRVSAFRALLGQTSNEDPLQSWKGSALLTKKAKHPFLDKTVPVIASEYVLMDVGTGVVHTAPGHGMEDYLVGKREGLPIFSPVDHRGRYTAEVKGLEGTKVLEANTAVIQWLEDEEVLWHKESFEHSYPHCWRCHKAVFYRATPQWFVSMKNIRPQALDSLKDVTFVPDWGRGRLESMVETRPDWCLSRQRAWGVPIPAVVCQKCGHGHLIPEVIESLVQKMQQEDTDVWFQHEAAYFLPEGMKCEACGYKAFDKGQDILDVWFDSGMSHGAVLEARGLSKPADLYLEGSDQHRGWFQTSLLTSIGLHGEAPYKGLLTHGYVNDDKGRKMSKSLGNVVSPLELIRSHGSEILRLWIIQEDYRHDLSFSKVSFDRVAEAYRKIRNSFRFMLGNIHDFEPAEMSVPIEALCPLDRWALAHLSPRLMEIERYFSQYEFHKVFHEVIQMTVVDLSSVYFDILKDRLYTSGKMSHERRSSQTVLWLLTRTLARMLAPVLSFTMEEVWSHLPGEKESSVFLASFPGKETFQPWKDPGMDAAWEMIWSTRAVVLGAIEVERKEKRIGHAREVCVQIEAPPALMEKLLASPEPLHRLFLVSEVQVREGPQLLVHISRSQGEKCPRCWTFVAAETLKEKKVCVRCQVALGMKT